MDIEVGNQLWIQTKSVLFTVAYSSIITFILLKLTALVARGLRVTTEQEHEGLDLVSHNERAYTS